MTLTSDSVRAALAPRPARFYDTLGSTNDVALDWLREGAPAGAVVVADEQTKGRGRLGRGWYAPPNTALMCSVILRPRPEHLTRITMLGALAIADVLDALNAGEVSIKWPNDVRLNGRKICGVLPEAAWEGDTLLGVVLGMGINVRIDFGGTPLEETAISLEPALGRPVDRLDLLRRLIDRIDAWAARLDSDALFEAWRGRLTMLGQRVTIRSTDGAVTGLAETVDADGVLWIRTDDGDLRRVYAGDLALGEQG
jgi:BirA family biotin operon repressor/biotin-[acetyl-CoA-carboxylase] ligase